VSVVLVVTAVLLGLLALLAVPLEVVFRCRGIEAVEAQVAMRWLFGLVRFRFRVPDRAKHHRRPTPVEEGPECKRAQGGEKGRRANLLAVIRQQDFRRRAYRLARDLLRATRLRQLGLRLRLGLGDPAETGRLWAVVGPLNAMAQNLRNADVRIEPEFVDPVLEFDAHGRILLVPLQLLTLLIAFALSPAAIRAWRVLRTDRA